jgi:hypothetical protein
MRYLFALLLAVALMPSFAEARPRRYVRVVRPPAVRVVVNPWAYGYHPAARDGWSWVEGYYAPDGTWIPGYWSPNYERPGYAWVPGYWEGDRYVDGYWREAQRPGFVWVDGYYDRGRWVAGYWAPSAPPPPAPPPPAPAEVHHDYGY